MEKFCGFRGLASNRESFPANFFFFILADSGPASDPVRTHGWNISGKMPHYLISRFINCDSISISWIIWLIFTYKSFANDGCPIILIDIETSKANCINTPAANMITRVSNYTFIHVCTVNCLLRDAGFFCELHAEAIQSRKFPTNNKKIMQLRNFSTANDLHYTVVILVISDIGKICAGKPIILNWMYI